MIKCYAAPYEGEKEFVFFSYCHKDAPTAYSMIERLSLEGVRVWYDDGLHPGDYWPEIIASHLQNAAVVIASVTKASVESTNCKNEVTFALNNNKPFISVVIGDFPMPLGIRMQLSSSQYLKSPETPGEDVYSQILQSSALSACRDSRGASPTDLDLWRKHSEEYFSDKLADPKIPAAKYAKALNLMAEGRFEEAIVIFENLGDYKDSKAKLEEAKALQEMKLRYETALSLLSEHRYEEAAAAFSALGDYKDSPAKAAEARKKIGAASNPDKGDKEQRYTEACQLMKEEQYSEAVALFRTIADYRDSLGRKLRCSELGSLTVGRNEPANDYKTAQKLLDSENFEGAISAYEAFGDYKDSKAKLEEAKKLREKHLQYETAIKMLSENRFEDAAAAFDALGDYKDSLAKAAEARKRIKPIVIPDDDKAQQYAEACRVMEAGQYLDAVDLFRRIYDYKDSICLKWRCIELGDATYSRTELSADYKRALKMLEAGNLESAIAAFEAFGDYKDSREKLAEARKRLVGEPKVTDDEEKKYAEACRLMEEEQYPEATELFRVLGDYRDSIGRKWQCLELGESTYSAVELKSDYRKAQIMMESGNFEGAIAAFEAFGDYKDSREKLAEAIRLRDALKIPTAILLHIESGSVIILSHNPVTIGRDGDKSDFTLPDKMLSKTHARIHMENEKLFLTDLNSTSGSLINGEPALPKIPTELADRAWIKLADENFLVLLGESCRRVFNDKNINILQCISTGECRMLDENGLLLDRNHRWRNKVLGSRMVSRANQTVISFQGEQFCVEDMGSPNGTLVNGQTLKPSPYRQPLVNGDEITIVNDTFRYIEIPVTGDFTR